MYVASYRNLVAERDDFLRPRLDDPRVPRQGAYVAHADAAVYGDAVGSFHGTRSGEMAGGKSFNGTKVSRIC